jgi:hypothetical protein
MKGACIKFALVLSIACAGAYCLYRKQQTNEAKDRQIVAIKAAEARATRMEHRRAACLRQRVSLEAAEAGAALMGRQRAKVLRRRVALDAAKAGAIRMDQPKAKGLGICVSLDTLETCGITDNVLPISPLRSPRRAKSKKKKEKIEQKNCIEKKRKIEHLQLTESPTDLLHQQLLSFNNYLVDSSQLTRVYKESIVGYLQGCVAGLWPSSELVPYGSFATGLSSPQSDIDLVLRNTPGLPEDLVYLQKYLNSMPVVTTTRFIPSKIVPLLKLKVNTGGGCVDIDISLDSERHCGLKTYQWISTVISSDFRFAPLVRILKQLLLCNGKHEMYKGGMSSHLLSILVYHWLKDLQDSHLHTHNIGRIFLDFLKAGGVGHKRHHTWVDNPLCPWQNIAEGCFGFATVRDLFRKTHDQLVKGLHSGEQNLLGILFPNEQVEEHLDYRSGSG